MWFSLFCLVLILAVAFFQSIHGLFSGLIFCVLTIVSATLAFGLYEWVAYTLLIEWKPDLALPIALAVCFGLPLTLSRLALDSLIPRAGLLPALAERVGGAVFGLITAVLIAGVTTTALQMLPFGGSLLGFQRFGWAAAQATEDDQKDPQRDLEAAKRALNGEDNRLFFSPDRFAAGFVSMLSDGIFSGERSFRMDHPDLLTEIGWSQCIFAECLHLAKPDSVRITGPEVVNYVHKAVPGGRDSAAGTERRGPQARHEFWLLTLKPGEGARDAEKMHRFTLPQIRLVGRDGPEPDSLPVQFIPIAIRDEEYGGLHMEALRRSRDPVSPVFQLWRPAEDDEIQVVFEVPVDFVPDYVTYKTGARVELRKPRPDDVHIPPPRGEDPAAARAEEPGERRSASSERGGRGRGDRVSGVRVEGADTSFSDRLPVTLAAYDGRDIEVDRVGKVLESGHVVAVLGEEGSSAAIEGFQVPEGSALLQVSVEDLRAGSTLGRALSFAVKTIRNYLVTDDRGKRYEMVGQYAIAEVDGQQIIEVQYFPEQIGSLGRGIREFQRIKRRHLERSDTQIYYLYLVDSGRTAVSFGTGRRTVDLKGRNLVAP